MTQVDKLLVQMQDSAKGIRFADLILVCDHFFGPSRQQGTSHRV